MRKEFNEGYNTGLEGELGDDEGDERKNWVPCALYPLLLTGEKMYLR